MPDDSVSVEALLNASYPTLMASTYKPAVLAPVLELITKANKSLLESGTYYLAEAHDGSIIGCGGWTLEKPPGSNDIMRSTGHLRHFATHPDWIRRGIGRTIYRQCEAEARAANVQNLEVYASLNGEAFYAAMGFERIRTIAVPIGPTSFPGVLMRRAI